MQRAQWGWRASLIHPCFLSIFLLGLCPGAPAWAEQNSSSHSELTDSALTAIRDGYDLRVAEMFDAQKAKTFSDFKPSGWNDPQRYAYPRIEFATANLWLGLDIDAANTALVEYGEYFIQNPDQVLHRDYFHWHSEMALRLIEFYGPHGIKHPGLIETKTVNAIMEAVWLYAKRRQADQIPNNTKAEPDLETSNTWYIYESENHHAQSFCTLWHFAKLAQNLPDFKDRRYDDGLTPAEHYQKWNEYLKVYFAERAKKGIFIEMMSRDYNEKTLKGIFNIYDFADDPELKRRAGMYIDLYLTYIGQEQIDGILGGGKARIYSDISPSSSELAYLFFGIGEKVRFTSTLLSAMTTTYRPPLVVIDIACDRSGRGCYEIEQRVPGLAEPGFYEPPVYHMRTDEGLVRYSYCTPDFILGTVMSQARPFEDWALISSQNRSQGVIFSGSTAAGILPQCEHTKNNRAYNSMWSVQSKGTLITQKLKDSNGTGKARIWFSSSGLTPPAEKNQWIFTESEGAYAAVRIVAGCHHWEDGPARANGRWLYCDNEYSPIILEVDRKANYSSFDEFRVNVLDNDLSLNNNILHYISVNGDAFTFFADYSEVPQINGIPVDYAPAKVYDSPFLKSDWNSGVVHIQKGTRSLTLDFNGPQDAQSRGE